MLPLSYCVQYVWEDACVEICPVHFAWMKRGKEIFPLMLCETIRWKDDV